MSPLWGSSAKTGLLVHWLTGLLNPLHRAPLERRRWTYRDSIDISLRWSERTHVAPLGLWVVGIGYCYKHVAPLGLCWFIFVGFRFRSTQPTTRLQIRKSVATMLLHTEVNGTRSVPTTLLVHFVGFHGFRSTQPTGVYGLRHAERAYYYRR